MTYSVAGTEDVLNLPELSAICRVATSLHLKTDALGALYLNEPYDDIDLRNEVLAVKGAEPDLSSSCDRVLAALNVKIAVFGDVKGGPGSGFEGHAGRPGERGGSAPIGAGGSFHDPVTERDWQARAEHVEDEIRVATDKNMTTDRTNEHGVDGLPLGVWKPDRVAQQLEIANQILDGAKNVPNEGKVIMLGGMSGAGKTSLLQSDEAKSLGIEFDAKGNPTNYLVINPDDIKEILAERGMVPIPDRLSPMESSPLAHEEASHIANDLVAAKALAEGKNIIFDITMNSPESVTKRLNMVRSLGPSDHITNVFVDAPVEQCIGAAYARWQRGQAKGGLGGRLVPQFVMASQRDPTGEYNSVNRRAFEATKHMVDRWMLFDNTGFKHRLVAQG